MNFVNTDGAKKIVSGFVSWIRTKLQETFFKLTVSQSDSTKDDWDMSASSDATIKLNTTDWRFTKWSETTTKADLAATCAPKADMSQGYKGNTGYFNSVSINPSLGRLRTQGSIAASGFAMVEGTNTQIITGDGGYLALSAVNIKNSIPICTTMIYYQMMLDNMDTRIHPISDDTFDTFLKLEFFQTMDEGLIFKRINNNSAGNPMFMATYMSNIDTIGTLIASVVADPGLWGGNYCIIFGEPNGSKDFSTMEGNEITYDDYIEIETSIS